MILPPASGSRTDPERLPPSSLHWLPSQPAILFRFDL